MANRSYREIVDASTINFEFWTGDYSNHSTTSIGAIAAIGTPKFMKRKNVQSLVQMADGDGLTSNAVSRVVDVTTAFTVEFALTALTTSGAGNFIIRQGTGGGGFAIYCVPPTATTAQYVLVLYDGAGAAAQYVYYSGGILTQRDAHFLYNSRTGGTSGAIWLDGNVVTTSLSAVSPAANISVNKVITLGTGGGTAALNIIRIYPFSLDDDDARILYRNYNDLKVTSKV